MSTCALRKGASVAAPVPALLTQLRETKGCSPAKVGRGQPVWEPGFSSVQKGHEAWLQPQGVGCGL